jgi:hypothetical protein
MKIYHDTFLELNTCYSITMSKYFGNLSSVIDQYINLRKLENGFVDILNIQENSENDTTSTAYKIQEMLKSAGYKDPAWEGKSYYPNFHFSKDLVYDLDKIFGTVALNCWISEIPVGKVSPPHYDIDPRENELKSSGEIVRYSIHLGEPVLGHAFFIGDKVHYMETHGSTYKWNNPNELHSASNAGLKSKYMLIYGGIKFYKKINVSYQWNDRLTEDSGFILWNENGETHR